MMPRAVLKIHRTQLRKADDGNNPLLFMPVIPPCHVFSNGTTETWYIIQFRNGEGAVPDMQERAGLEL